MIVEEIGGRLNLAERCFSALPRRLSPANLLGTRRKQSMSHPRTLVTIEVVMGNPLRPDTHVLRFGVFELDPDSQELRKHGVLIKLSHQPFQALVLLLEHEGEIVTREALRNSLWPDE